MSDKQIGEKVFVTKIIPQQYGEDAHRAQDEERYLAPYVGKAGHIAGVDADSILPYIVQFDAPIAGRVSVHLQRFRDEEIARYDEVRRLETDGC